MDFVGTVGEAQAARARVGADQKFVVDAGGAVRLDRPVDHLAGDVGRDDLDHRDLLLRDLVADGVHQVRRLQHQQARLLDHAARFGDPLLPHGLARDLGAERDAAGQPLHHQLERALGEADEAHAVVDAAGTEPSLRDLEAAPFALQHVGRGHAHVGEIDLHVPVRRVVGVEHGERPDAP